MTYLKDRRSAFSSLDPAVRMVWAKSGCPDHHLISHMLDVAAVCECILEREPSASIQTMISALGIQSPNPERFIAACVGAHDLGKAIPGFQAKWEPAVENESSLGLTFSSRALRYSKHGQASAKSLEILLSELITNSSQLWFSQIAAALGSHHGYPLLRTEIAEALPAREDAVWVSLREKLMRTYWSVLSPKVCIESVNLLTTPALASFTGLVSICDWIASNQKWFPLGERKDNLYLYFEHAKQLACRALEQIGWNRFKSLIGQADTSELLGKILNLSSKVELRPLQKAACDLLQNSDGPVLMIVEAPMGEGKTELAFLSHLLLQQRNGHRGLYVALPTQATGKAMYSRVRQFLTAFNPDNAQSLQLIYSGASISKLSEQSQNFSDVRQGLCSDEAFELDDAASWFTQSKRPLIAPDGVGTVDQALFSILNVRFHSVRVWALSNRVVVIDEVHAYDSYTGGLIELLLSWLKALHCSVILMSATLPLAKRDSLLQAWGANSSLLPQLTYPRILLVQDRSISYKDNIHSRVQPPIMVQGCREDLQTIVSTVSQAFEYGGCGAVIFNTVDRAQQFYSLIKESLSDDVTVILFHSRFPSAQRSGIEKRVLSIFGKDCKRPKKALLIATQVAEQSLDVDFDFLVSDLAPIDLLLQRVGRLHRHKRECRPKTHMTPVFTVAGLLPDQLPEFDSTGWGYVYPKYLLMRSWASLMEVINNRLHLPQDIDRLVQQVYDKGFAFSTISRMNLNDMEAKYLNEYERDITKKYQLALNIAVDAHAEPFYAYAGKPRGHEPTADDGLINCTRLGAQNVSIIPLFTKDQRFCFEPDTKDCFSLDKLTHEQIALLWDRRITISNKKVVCALKKSDKSLRVFNETLLKGSIALIFDDYGSCRLDDQICLKLDQEQGLIIVNGKKDARKVF